MRAVLGVTVFLLASLPVLGAEKSAFQAKPVEQYPNKLTSEKVTIAAEPFTTDEQAKEAFGKVNPWRLGVLPILLVVKNNGKDAIRLDRLRLVYQLPDRTKIDNTPAGDLRFIGGAKRPKTIPTPIGAITKGGKSPFSEWEIEGRAFSAKVLPPGETASGFVYFETPTASDAASLYISGLVNAVTGVELYYFDIALSGNGQ
jgi:hypothetical protein